MYINFVCPFFRSDNVKKRDRQGGRVVVCEGGKCDAPSKREQRDYRRKYCCSKTGWRECTLAQMMLRYYGQEDEKHEQGE